MGDGEGDEFAAVPEREEELVLVEDGREKGLCLERRTYQLHA